MRKLEGKAKQKDSQKEWNKFSQGTNNGKGSGKVKSA
jgi:hypothetical protein